MSTPAPPIDHTDFMNALTQFHDMLKGVNNQELVDRFSNNIYMKTFPELFSDYANETSHIIKCLNISCQIPSMQKPMILESLISAIETFISFILSVKEDPKYNQMSNLFKKLFSICVVAKNDKISINSYFNSFSNLFHAKKSVIYIQDNNTKDLDIIVAIINLIIALKNNMEIPFTLSVVQNKNSINTIVTKLTNILGDEVVIECDVKKMIDIYKQKVYNKPIIGFFSPRDILFIMKKCEKENIDVINKTRFSATNYQKRCLYMDILNTVFAEISQTTRIKNHFFLCSYLKDQEILDLYKDVQEIKLNITKFTIKDETVTIDNPKLLNKEAFNKIMKYIVKMADNQIQPGSILVYASNPNNINQIREMFDNESQKRKHEKLIILTKLNKCLDITEFLKENIKPDFIYVIPVYIETYTKAYLKQFSTMDVENYNNVIKVIVTMEYLQDVSDDLSVIIDLNRRINDFTNLKNNITIIDEKPSSQMLHLIRRNNLGLTRPGICVDIKIKGEVYTRMSQVLINDISHEVLDLKKMGISVEKLKLPEEIPQEKMNYMFKEFLKLNILSKDAYALTPFGKKVSNFPFIHYISSAISILSEQYGDDQNIAALLASLTMLVTNITITKLNSKLLVKNFEKDSDFATIIKSLFDVMINKEETISPLDNPFKPGMISEIETSLKEIADNLNVNYEGIWLQMKNFYEKCDYINTFAQNLFKLISEHSLDGEWGQARMGSFNSISIGNQISATYKCNELIKFSDKSTISISSRPGQVSLDFPSHAYIVNITRNAILHTINGSFIHINNSFEQGPHPQSIIIEAYLNNPFFTSVLEGYLGVTMRELNTINSSNGSSSSYFYISEIDSEHCSFNFYPKDSKIADIVIKSISDLKCLAPYIGQTILIHHQMLNSCISIKSYGTDKYENQIIHYDKTSLHPYNINKNTISFLLKFIKEIPKFGYSKTIAFTGEDMVYPLDPDEPIEEDEGQISMPSTYHSCKSVFGMKSHLVILSDEIIPNEKELKWVCDEIDTKSAKYENNNSAIAVLYYRNTNAKLVGQLPTMDYSKIDNDSTISPLNKIIRKLTTGCIENHCLKSGVMFQDIEIEGNTFFGKTIGSYYKLMKTKQLLPLEEIEEISNKLKHGEKIDSNIDKIYTNPKFVINIKAFTKFMAYFQDKGTLYHNSNCNNGVPILLINDPSKAPEIVNESMKILKPFGFNNFEIINSITVPILNHKKYKLNNKEFEEKISQCCDKFGKIIIHKYPLQVNSKNKNISGSIKLVLISKEFISPVMNEIKSKIFKSVHLNIPPEVAPSIIARLPKVMKAILDWAKNNKLNLWYNNGSILGTIKDVNDAMALMKVNKPKIPYTAYPIPHGYDLNKLYMNRKKDFFVNKATRELFVADTISEQTVFQYLQSFQNESITDKTLGNDEIPNVLADEIGCCDNPATQSTNPVNIFFPDGTVISRPICLTCAKDLIKYSSLKNLVDQYDEIKLDDLLEVSEIIDELSLYPCTIDAKTQIYWPIIPFCQLMWTLLSSPISNQAARAYFTVIVSIMIHKSPMFWFCPIHAKYMYDTSIKKCKVEGCNMILCQYCKQPHGDKEICKSIELLNKVPPGYRKCPNCGMIVEKTSACNHISCRCGKHFCYYCGGGPFETGDDCYDHMSRTKNVEGTSDNHWQFPPDWYRFIEKKTRVSDEVLNKFFDAYPQFKPL